MAVFDEKCRFWTTFWTPLVFSEKVVFLLFFDMSGFPIEKHEKVCFLLNFHEKHEKVCFLLIFLKMSPTDLTLRKVSFSTVFHEKTVIFDTF